MKLSRDICSLLRLLLAASGQQHHSARCYDHGGLQLLQAKATDLLDSKSRMTTHPHVNSHQCKLLAKKLVRTLSLVERADICDHERLFHELHAICDDAAALIDLCQSRHSQPYKLISLSQSREAFAVILSKLTWYATAFLVQLDFLGILSQALSDIWHLELREAAREDFKIHADLSNSNVMEINRCDIEVDHGRLIGVGAFGRVYKAKWLEESWPCAVKEFNDGTVKKEEAAMLASLHHPNIIQFYGILDESSLVMELMDFDLKHLCQAELDLIVAVDIMLQAAEGMRYLHELDIVHRDLKAANILIKVYAGGTYLVKLTDFGLARTEVKFVQTEWSYKVGTLKWRAPELLEKIREDRLNTDPIFFPKPADVYSFGITCSEILTGKVPYSELENATTGLPTEVIREKILQGQRPWLPLQLPAQLVALIERCWERNPDRRPNFNFICFTLKHIKASLLKEQRLARRRGCKSITTLGDPDQVHEAHRFFRTVSYSALRL